MDGWPAGSWLSDQTMGMAVRSPRATIKIVGIDDSLRRLMDGMVDWFLKCCPLQGHFMVLDEDHD